MESSDSSLSGDWDVVSQKEISEEVEEEPTIEVNLSNGMNEVKECSSMGSGVQVLTEEDTDHHNVILSETNVNRHNEILNEIDVSHHNDSNSSSDIDVIEEGDEDMHRSGMLLSPIDFLSTTLAQSGTLVPAIAPAPVATTEDGWNNFLLTHRLLRNPQFKDCLIIIFISIAVAATMHLQGTPEDKIKQMKEQVDELKKENTGLKDRVIFKIEDEKLFQALEEQINAFRQENQKLSGSLEYLVNYLLEKTENEKEVHHKEADCPYQIELAKLKEQVNLLKIDNDDLQQQLVRTRYGAPSENAKEDSGKKEVKLDQKKDVNENSSDIPAKEIEEIEKLKKMLLSEVNDLKDWKESVDNLIKQLNEKEKKDHEGDFKNKKSKDDGKSRKHTKEETHEKKKKGKFYDWSWDNFRSSFDNINFSDMLSKYANVNEKKIKDYFESVGNYIKKAQEKTKNMFKRYNEKKRGEVWDFLGSLRYKWDTMKDEFFKSQQKKGPMPPEHESGNFASDFSEKLPKFENEKKKSTGLFDNLDPTSNGIPIDEQLSMVEYLMQSRRMKPLIGKDSDWLILLKQFLENEQKLTEHGKKPENSWLFRRAAVRSILREQEEAEDSTNWFLRRKKAKEDVSGLPKEEDNLIN